MCSKVADLGTYDLAYLAQVLLRLRDRPNEDAGWPTAFVGKAKKLDDGFLTLYELLVQPRALAVVQDLSCEIEGEELRRPALRDLPTHEERGERGELVLPLLVRGRDLRRLRHVQFWRKGLRRNVGEVGFYEL